MTVSYLTAPKAEKTQRTYRYMVEMASNELEHECDSVKVPKHFQIVDVVETEPTLTARASFNAAVGWLSD